MKRRELKNKSDMHGTVKKVHKMKIEPHRFIESSMDGVLLEKFEDNMSLIEMKEQSNSMEVPGR